MPINLTYFPSFIPLEQGLVGSGSEDTFLIHVSDSRAQGVGKVETQHGKSIGVRTPKL